MHTLGLKDEHDRQRPLTPTEERRGGAGVTMTRKIWNQNKSSLKHRWFTNTGNTRLNWSRLTILLNLYLFDNVIFNLYSRYLFKTRSGSNFTTKVVRLKLWLRRETSPTHDSFLCSICSVLVRTLSKTIRWSSYRRGADSSNYSFPKSTTRKTAACSWSFWSLSTDSPRGSQNNYS